MQIDSDNKQHSFIELPAIAVNVVPLLPLKEALDLGTCSKYLNSLCECERTWKEWYISKWGPLSVTNIKGESSKNPSLNNKGWKAMYIERHKKLHLQIINTFKQVRLIRDEDLSSDEFFNEINRLIKLNVNFDDVYFFLLRKDINVVFNVLGIYYCYFILGVPEEDIKKVVLSRQLADRLACISWCRPKNTLYMYYLPEYDFTKVYSLGDIMQDGMIRLYIFRETTIQSNLWILSKVKVSSKIPEPKSETESKCDCAECRPNSDAGPSSS